MNPLLNQRSLPLELHNVHKFHFSTCPEGAVHFLDNNKFGFIRGFIEHLSDKPIIEIEMIISELFARDCVFVYDDGDYEMIVQHKGSSLVFVDDAEDYIVVLEGDALVVSKDLNVKFVHAPDSEQRIMYLNTPYHEEMMEILEYNYPEEDLTE